MEFQSSKALQLKEAVDEYLKNKVRSSTYMTLYVHAYMQTRVHVYENALSHIRVRAPVLHIHIHTYIHTYRYV